MDSDAWVRLSEWHNSWLQSSAGERDRLRREFVTAHPSLTADVDALVSAGPIAPGFLETPALALSLDVLASQDAPLVAGTMVGPYRIVELLARGGMGQVYRATDVRLDRDVAVKLVSGGSQHEPGVVDRFIQEARITAALDCPNIVQVFDVGSHAGRPFLVMELLHGQTLRHRLLRGPLPAAEAVAIALQVARGLVVAHAASLIHHDLKPENLFLTSGGQMKILDFGVARLAPASTFKGADLNATAGVLIGTAGYLAPEELLGDPVDARADLFALGAILYEMIAGRRAFARDHAIDTLSAVLHEAVPPLSDHGVSPELAAIVTRLLQKSPPARFQSAADLAWVLERLGAPVAPPPMRATPSSVGRRWLMAVLVGAVLGAGGFWLGRARPQTPAGPALSQFTWRLPGNLRLLSDPIVAPVGRRIAFVAGDFVERRRLFVRELSSLEARPLPGTEGARQPFWSPDGRRLGFFANGKLAVVTVEGGVPSVLADAPDPRGGTWGPAGTIVFAPVYRDAGLLQISSAGGPVTPVTKVDDGSDDTGHRWPVFLPDGVHFLYQNLSVDNARHGIYVGSLDGQGSEAILFASNSGAVFVPSTGNSGTILTAGREGIEARTFDSKALKVLGEVRRLPLRAAASTPHEPTMLSASADVLAVAKDGVPWGLNIVVMAGADHKTEVLTEPELGGWPRLSPDGRRLVRSWVDPDRGNPNLWVRDLERNTQVRVTSGRDFDVSPVWSPDGTRIAYRAGMLAAPRLAFAQADGTGRPETRACPGRLCEPTDWSGNQLLLNVDDDVWIAAASGGPSQPLLNGPFVERDARFSPDGTWVVYVSEESGRPEVSLRRLQGITHRVVISNDGGDQPVWSRDGSAVFYVNHEQRLRKVTARRRSDGSVDFGRSEPVGPVAFDQRHWGTAYDVSPDGQRVFLPLPPDAEAPVEMTIVVGWRALLR